MSQALCAFIKPSQSSAAHESGEWMRSVSLLWAARWMGEGLAEVEKRCKRFLFTYVSESMCVAMCVSVTVCVCVFE